VVMYWLDFIISFTSILFWMYDSVILTIQQFVMYAYPTIAPLVQLSSDKRIIRILKNFTPSASRFSKKILFLFL
jgi:vomeronasal1 receptor